MQRRQIFFCADSFIKYEVIYLARKAIEAFEKEHGKIEMQ